MEVIFDLATRYWPVVTAAGTREVGALLGHRNEGTTRRYLNIVDKRKREANARGARAVLSAVTEGRSNSPSLADSG